MNSPRPFSGKRLEPDLVATRLHAVSLAHASVAEIVRIFLVTAALLMSLIVTYIAEGKTSVAWAVIVSGIFFILGCIVICSDDLQSIH